MHGRIAMTLFLAVVACACQSQKAGMEILCNAPIEVQKEAGWSRLHPAEKAVYLAKWVDDRVSNSEVRKAFEALAYVDPAEKAVLLKQLAREAGLDSCAMADFFEERNKQPAGGPGVERAEAGPVPSIEEACAAFVDTSKGVETERLRAVLMSQCRGMSEARMRIEPDAWPNCARCMRTSKTDDEFGECAHYCIELPKKVSDDLLGKSIQAGIGAGEDDREVGSGTGIPDALKQMDEIKVEYPKERMVLRGGRSRETVWGEISEHEQEIRRCYEKVLVKNRQLAGKVTMEWAIRAIGTVSVVKTKFNGMPTPALAMCLSARIKNWKFPAAAEGMVVVTQPFVFSADFSRWEKKNGR